MRTVAVRMTYGRVPFSSSITAGQTSPLRPLVSSADKCLGQTVIFIGTHVGPSIRWFILTNRQR